MINLFAKRNVSTTYTTTPAGWETICFCFSLETLVILSLLSGKKKKRNEANDDGSFQIELASSLDFLSAHFNRY